MTGRRKLHARCRAAGGKAKFRTLDAALQDGQQQLARTARTVYGRHQLPVLWAYECEVCGRYHLTSKPHGRNRQWRVPDPEGTP